MPTDGSIPFEQVEHFCLSLADHPVINTRIGAGLSYTSSMVVISDFGLGLLSFKACNKSRILSRNGNAESQGAE